MKSALLIASALFLLVGCDAIDAMKATKDMKSATNSMNAKMDKTNKGIEETNESVRLQKLILSKNDMLDDKNTVDLEPVALGMIAGAKKFGETATTEELIEYTRVLLLKIKDQRPDDSLRGPDGKFPANIAAEYDHKKLVDLNQIYTIAGFCPEQKVAQIIEEQIYGGGLYQRTAYVFLMARVQFLGTYMQETLLAEPMDTVKIMNEAIVRLGSIDAILKTPFKNKIKMEINTFIAKDPIVVSLYDETGAMDDSWNAPKLWKKVMKRFDQDLKDGNIVTGSSVKTDAVLNEIARLRATVQNYLDSWN
ncbi:MAG: hypothetical protein H7177_07185 [Rhizobacter sp.]|nr:hypothetical protein [Bacteriovorax sp.]